MKTDKIIKALPLDDYKIEIITSGGISGIFDVKPYLNGGAFKELPTNHIFALFVRLIMALNGQKSRILAPIQLYMIYKIPQKYRIEINLFYGQQQNL
ncbi:MAG: DUF2442 domain-containing protein [Deltaproteobacteria bacterium]|nr:DUF2442 domain-containing protein [Deltaproteobacteria bacterium]